MRVCKKDRPYEEIEIEPPLVFQIPFATNLITHSQTTST